VVGFEVMRRWKVAIVLVLAPLGAGAQPQATDDSEDEAPAPSASAEAQKPVAPRQTVTLKNGMVLVTGGRFTVGSSDPKAAPNERPPHDAAVKSFWLDRTEVTVGAYRACVEARKCDEPRKSAVSCTYDMGDDLLPVSCVRWQDADGYCRAQGKRLPTEVEWELAARGGGSYKYPWGNASSSCLTAATLLHDQTGRSCTGKRPARVGTYAVNVSPFGAVDMAGNVEEWTSDWYVEHTATGARTSSGASHVLRGGGWLSRPVDARTSARNWGSVVEAGANVGFRCASDGAP
jgi:formylglycine-generating enzyme required for sulfatase activity